MTSLADAYDRHAREVSRERLYLGVGLFAAGALLVVAAIAAAATGLLNAVGLSVFEAREVAGTLAGLGVPAVFVGVFTVLPASRRQRAAAAVGASVAVFGVTLFRYAYPGRWYDAAGLPTLLTLAVVAVYFAGTITTFWYLFTAAATFKRRNDPGGTVELTVSRDGRTHTVEVAEDSVDEAREALGGVGVFGGIDDPETTADDEDADVLTDGPASGGDRSSRQSPSADPATASASGDGFTRGGDDGWATSPPDSTGGNAGGASGSTGGGFGDAAPTSDGGAAGTDISSPLDDDGEVLGESGPSPTDEYCGNCAHFEYVRTGDGMQPYCAFHREEMDDMEACADWQPNR